MLGNRATETEFLAKTRFLFAFCTFLSHEPPLIMSPIRGIIKEIQTNGTCRPAGALDIYSSCVLYTCRPAGAKHTHAPHHVLRITSRYIEDPRLAGFHVPFSIL